MKITEEIAHNVYKTASPELKEILEQSCPPDFFTTKKITERVNSVADALAVAGKTLSDILLPGDTKDGDAYRVIKFVISVLNEEWIPDYSNNSQRKYEPRFLYKSGFGLACDGRDGWGAISAVGVRLCYRSYEVMIHGVEILKEYYRDFLN